MITDISYQIENGRIYANIKRDSITEGEFVTIHNGSNTYTKYLPIEGLSVMIDITPYCEAELTGSIKQVYKNTSIGVPILGSTLGTVCRPLVNNRGGTMAYFRNRYNKYDVPLTNLPYIQVSKADGKYEIFLSIDFSDDLYARLSFGDAVVNIEPSGEEDLLYMRLQSFITPDYLIMEDNTNGITTTLPVRIVPSGMNTRRLVWLNEVGGIDSWSFEFLRESSFATTSEVFYSSTKGYTRTNRISERTHIIETRELDDITASVVAYVIASPEVYLMENGTLVPIDIVTEECRTYSDTELTAIQVAYRLKERETL